MENLPVAMFLNTTSIVSPTSACSIGPSTPRCFSAAVLVFCTLNRALLYSRYTTFLYLRPIRLSPEMVKVFASLKQKCDKSHYKSTEINFCCNINYQLRSNAGSGPNYAVA